MPIYEYECLDCGISHEIMQKITESPLTSCPDCGGTLKKKISNTSFVLKGTGWYVTDYASGRRKEEVKEEKTQGDKKKKTDSSSDTAKDSGSSSEAKADAKKAVSSR